MHAFTGPYAAQCLRCAAPIQVTKEVITLKDDSAAPKTAAHRPVQSETAERPLAARTVLNLPPAPAKATEAARPPEKPPASPTKSWKWMLPGVLVLVALAGGAAAVYPFIAGRISPPPRPPRADGGRRPAADAKAIIAAALANGGQRFEKVCLLDAALADGELTITGYVPTLEARAEVEAEAVRALAAGPDRPKKVVNRLQGPLDVARDVAARKFGKEVEIRSAVIRGASLTLEGDIAKWEYLQAVRAEVVAALNEAGLGPITAWENRLRRPKKGG